MNKSRFSSRFARENDHEFSHSLPFDHRPSSRFPLMPNLKLVPAALVFSAAVLSAQPTLPTTNARVRAALDMLKADNAWTLQQQVELTAIPAPPFKESVRAAEYKRRLEALGLENVRMDSVGNVIAERRGTGTGPTGGTGRSGPLGDTETL